MASGSNSSFVHFPNMLEALKADYQVISRTFASVSLILRKMAAKASTAQGWTHGLVEKWLKLWAYFKKLHQRAQRDSNRLATCLRLHHPNVKLMVADDMSQEEKQEWLATFRKEVLLGNQQAEQLADEYEQLLDEVERFPSEIKFHAPSEKRKLIKIGGHCRTIYDRIRHFLKEFSQAVTSQVRQTRIALFKNAEPAPRSPALYCETMSNALRQLDTVSANVDILYSSSQASLQSGDIVSIRPAMQETKEGCKVIISKVDGFRVFWQSLLHLCDDLDLYITQYERNILSTIRMRKKISQEMDVAYERAIEALRAFATFSSAQDDNSPGTMPTTPVRLIRIA